MVNLKKFYRNHYNWDYKYLPKINLPLENESRYDPTLTEDEEMPLIPKIQQKNDASIWTFPNHVFLNFDQKSRVIKLSNATLTFSLDF